MLMLDSGTKKMLMQGDFDLNSVPRYTDSFKEVIKQTILKQEFVFRTQVLELHQLYRTQKSLMKDLGHKRCDAYNSWDANVQSSLLPFTNRTRCDRRLNDKGHSSVTMVGSTAFMNQELLNGCQDPHYRLKQMPLDLQLSADEFINHAGENLSNKRTVWNYLKEPIDTKRPMYGNCSYDTETLKLSLTTGDGKRRIGGTVRNWFDKETRYCPVIDLESDESISDDYAKCTPSVGCDATEIHSKGDHKSQVSVFSGLICSTGAKKDPSLDIAESSSFQEHSDCYQDQTSASKDAGIMEGHDDSECNNLSTKVQQSSSYQKAQLDLNKVYLEDSRFSNDPMLAYPSPASSAGDSAVIIGSKQEEASPTMLWKKVTSNCSSETLDVLPEDNFVNAAPADINRTTKSTDIWTGNTEHDGMGGDAVNPTGPEPMSMSQVGVSEYLDSCIGEHKNDDLGLDVKITNGLSHDSNQISGPTIELSSEKSQVEDSGFSHIDQSQNGFQDGRGNQSPASCKSSCIYDNDSSSGKTMHTGNRSGDLNRDLKNHLGSQAADALTDEHDQRTSDSCDLKHESYESKEEESAEADVLMKRAAESLVSMSFNNAGCDQDSGCKDLRNEKRERPQYTCDSFELIVMNLTDSNVDENSVTSKPYELNDAAAKDFGAKLRRGRRMKDFQKEILPSLASLSRHEICEDINILEGILRSREYRKIRGKMAAANGEKWSPLVRSRRSRLNYVGRRNISWK